MQRFCGPVHAAWHAAGHRPASQAGCMYVLVDCGIAGHLQRIVPPSYSV